MPGDGAAPRLRLASLPEEEATRTAATVSVWDWWNAPLIARRAVVVVALIGVALAIGLAYMTGRRQDTTAAFEWSDAPPYRPERTRFPQPDVMRRVVSSSPAVPGTQDAQPAVGASTEGPAHRVVVATSSSRSDCDALLSYLAPLEDAIGARAQLELVSAAGARPKWEIQFGPFLDKQQAEAVFHAVKGVKPYRGTQFQDSILRQDRPKGP